MFEFKVNGRWDGGLSRRRREKEAIEGSHRRPQEKEGVVQRMVRSFRL